MDAQPAEKLRIEKLSDGGVTCLRLAGTIDEDFDGKKLAQGIKADTLVLDVGGVRKISSFGIREWVDFVGAAGERVGDLVLVECSPKIIDQLNMVLNFAGRGRVFSFYAPYRCDYCDLELRVLLQVDRDHEAIRALKPPDRACDACGNPAYFDEDPASYFSYLAAQPPFELDGPVAAFLSAKLAYTVSESARRFRAEKHVEGRATYVRLSGDLDASFPAAKLAEGLEGLLVVDLSGIGKVDPPGAAGWRAFVAAVSVTCEAVWLVSCPPVFLERLARAEDLGKAQVISLTIPYTCTRCAATASHAIDVEKHFDVLKFATAPEASCPDCGAPARSAASEALLAHLGALSRPAVPADVHRFIGAARDRKPVLPAGPTGPQAAAPPRSALGTVLVASAAAAVVAIAVVVGWGVLARPAARTAASATGALVERSAAARPAWIGAMEPGYAACADGACVAASTQAADLDEARRQAVDAALEALAEWAGLSPELAPARDQYRAARQRALGGQALGREALEGRRAVAEALRATAPLAPARPAAEYWERYEGGTVAFVRFEVAEAVVAAIRAAYTDAAAALGARAVTLFPGMAWRHPGLRAGALLVAAEPGPLRDAGLAAGDIVLEVEGRPVASGRAFAEATEEARRRLEAAGGAIRLLVKSGDGEPRVFTVTVPRAVRERPRERIGGSTPAPAGGGVNVWDRTGGGDVRDDPTQ
jgi:anti-anti-sigma regulatory factor